MAALPYGIRDIKIQRYSDAAGTILGDTIVDLPNARTLSFTEEEEFQELRGDDRVVATHGNGPQITFSFEAGGLPLDVLPHINGGETTTSGTADEEVTTYQKKASGQRPWFKITGRVISDSGGDVHAVLHRCKLTENLEGEFTDGEFFLLSGGGVGMGLDDEDNDLIYEFVHNATMTPISATP